MLSSPWRPLPKHRMKRTATRPRRKGMRLEPLATLAQLKVSSPGRLAPECSPSPVTSAQIIQMLGANGLRRILQSHGLIGTSMARVEDEAEDNEDGYGGLARRRRKTTTLEGKFPKVPSENGRKLMDSGLYGGNDSFVDNRKKRKCNLGQRLMWRELGSDHWGAQKRANKLMSQVGR